MGVYIVDFDLISTCCITKIENCVVIVQEQGFRYAQAHLPQYRCGLIKHKERRQCTLDENLFVDISLKYYK